MDPFTHAAAGAALGEAVLGRRLGNKAAAYGAVLGITPDIDYLVAIFFSDAAQLNIHRTYTHSLLALVLVMLLMGWVLRKRYPGTQREPPVRFRQGSLLAGLAYGSHLLLDVMTSYGVQLFRPFSDTPIALYNISILDPAVLLPLAVGVLVALRLHRTNHRRRWVNAAGLTLAALYLTWSLFAQQRAQTAFDAMLDAEGIEVDRRFVKPTLLNTVLWRGLAETDTAFVHGFTSLFDSERSADLTLTPKHHDRLVDVQDSRPVQNLLRNMQHYHAVRERPDGTRSIVDMRFGRSSEWADQPSPYVFEFKVVERDTDEATIRQIQRSFGEADDRPDFREMWDRLRGAQ